MIFGRFLTIFDQYDEALHSKSCEILKILVEEGLLKNNRGFSLTCYPWSRIPPFLENICSMTKLVDLNLLRCDVPLEQLSTFFGSCPKLVELCVDLDLDGQELEMDDCLKNELERGFQKLKILTLSVEIDMDSWPVIKEIIM
jgi:hypothetical protein